MPYARFLHQLGIPYLVVTDGDARDATQKGQHPGARRAISILQATGESTDTLEQKLADDLIDEIRTDVAAKGIFLDRRTLEVDLVEAGAGPRMASTFRELRPQTEDATVAPFSAVGPLNDEAEDKIISLVLRQGVGKGRFAQRFASWMIRSDVPAHIEAAIRAAVDRSRHV